MRRYIICGEEKCHRNMRKVFYFYLYDSDVRIVKCYFRDKK